MQRINLGNIGFRISCCELFEFVLKKSMSVGNTGVEMINREEVNRLK